MTEQETIPLSPSDDRPVDRLLAEYLDLAAHGEVGDLATWLARLSTVEEQTEFMDLLAHATESLLAPGYRMGRYALREELGRGGMGIVFRAWDTRLERDVALKVLPPARVLHAEWRTRFERESQILARLTHPGIVTIHDVGSVGGLPFLVMDLVYGEELASLVGRLAGEVPALPSGARLLELLRRTEDPDAAPLLRPKDDYWLCVTRIAHGIAAAIEAAHGRGVWHRDLKPSNVKIRAGGAPVVLDFGIAASAQDPAARGGHGMFGTLCYMPPEAILGGAADNDARRDVYQLGLILYELLTLRRAFPDEDTSRVIARVRSGEFAAPSTVYAQVPPDLEAVCLVAMHKDPEARYQTARALREDLERILEHRETTVRPWSWRQRAGAMVVRHWRLAAVGTAAILVGVIAKGVLSPTEVSGPLQGIVWRDNEKLLVQVGDVVSAGNILGLRVPVPEASVVYAVSLSGTGVGTPQFITPLQPCRAADLGAGTALDWNLALPAGDQEIALSRIKLKKIQEEAPSWYEGLLLFRCRERSTVLEEWMKRLDHLRKDSLPGVPFEDARRALDEVSKGSRGESLGGPQEGPKLIRNLENIQIRSPTLLPVPGAQQYKTFFTLKEPVR